MKSFTIAKNDADKRLDKFILKAAPMLPKNLMYKYIRLKRIKVNGKKSDISVKLNVGDVVEMYINDEFFEPAQDKYDFLKAPASLDIVYEDENILLLNKKAGVLSHPDDGEYVDTLITRVMRYLYEKGDYDPKTENSFTPALANRIDRNTGGIVIAAKNAEALRVLNEKIKNREIDKRYLCIVIGCPKQKAATLTSYMIKDEKKNKVRVYSHPVDGGKTMITEYSVLETRNGLSLVEVRLHTGRTHQIRAHFASIGCPLLGDGKYGTNELNKKFGGYKKQCLYSYKLGFEFTSDSGILDYLNGKEFEANEVWFRDSFYKDELF
ncbi:MAG: RluA family pseudouridine synthase [Clostridia bacterium]|nr:RluA family pseudouridine synthase [Clostridia bacterium]